jgi:Trypsin
MLKYKRALQFTITNVLLIACMPALDSGSDSLISHGLPSCVKSMPNEYISTVALTTFASNEAFCTGVLISNQRVATAKHCIEGADPTFIDVIFSPDLANVSPSQRRSGIGKAISPNQDVAILFIGGIPAGSSYRSAQLLGNISDIGTGAQLRFLGYGAVNHANDQKGATSRYVRCATSKLSRFVPSYRVKEGNLYRFGLEFGSLNDLYNKTNAGFTENSPSICGGDSGGPIFVQHNGSFKLVGLNSASHPVCEILSNPVGADLRLATSFLLKSPVQDLRPKGQSNAITEQVQGPDTSFESDPEASSQVVTQAESAKGKMVTIELKTGEKLKGMLYHATPYYLYLSTV